MKFSNFTKLLAIVFLMISFFSSKTLANYKKVFLIDCGCNYGFYSFFTASTSNENYIISLEASTRTSKEFLKNLELKNLFFQDME